MFKLSKNATTLAVLAAIALPFALTTPVSAQRGKEDLRPAAAKPAPAKAKAARIAAAR